MTPVRNRFVLALLLFAACAARAGDLPDPRLTPGAINPEITQDNIQQTVCRKGYTKTIRPPAYYTNRLKKQQLREYGYAFADVRDFELDHLIALGIGGAPEDPRNLWPQPRYSEWNAVNKDDLELVLYKRVCANQIGLEQAQREMATNWIAAYKKYVGPNHRSHGFKHVD